MKCSVSISTTNFVTLFWIKTKEESPQDQYYSCGLQKSNYNKCSAIINKTFLLKKVKVIAYNKVSVIVSYMVV